MNGLIRSGLVAMVGMAAMLVVAATAARAQADPPSAGDAVQTEDVLLFRTGKLVHGQIIKETDTTVRIMVKIGTMPAVETEYAKEDILKIMHDQPIEAPKPKASDEASGPVMAGETDIDPGAARVYVIELTGVFGADISQTPIRKAVADAKKNHADYIVVVMDNDWSQALRGGLKEKELADDTAAFDQLWRAEDMDTVFTDEIPSEWSKPPKIVFWVKQAMGGAAFLPLVCRDVYFHPEARMGGIGNLSVMFGSMGDEVVRQKQYSLRMGHAEGMALTGGYDPRIVKAMARPEYQLWVRFVGDKPVFIERQEDVQPNDVLLTDDGKGANADTIQALARFAGNDVLTLDAAWAYKLGISKGTVATLDDLMYELGIERNYTRVDKKSASITENWTRDLARARKTLRKLWYEEYAEIQVSGATSRDRNKQRARQINVIKKMQVLLKKYAYPEKALSAGSLRIPDYATLNTMKEQIRLEIMRDK